MPNNNPMPTIENHQSAIENERIAVIVLAAGGSARMQGHIKQLLPWRGKTLIEHAIEIAQHSRADETLVVLGAHADVVRPVVEKTGARIIVNAEWETGQASSIRAGVSALTPDIAAAIFVNADQPFLTSAVIDALIARYRETGASIIASVFAGRRGNPALFARAHFAELQTLRGEQGGRALFAKYAVLTVEFDAQLGVDIDTWDDYTSVQ
ncbi:MAG: nucleotidyltransferase family protein [Anaerolineae bacterium]|nr:nucleotidyltransferase family protein [Anaerolineae bacterium]